MSPIGPAPKCTAASCASTAVPDISWAPPIAAASAGMTGGVILVHGDAGHELGHTMRRGLIAIGGRAGDFAGINMIAGTVIACGGCGPRPAAGMQRGTLAVFGERPSLLPTFRPGGECEPLFLRLYLRKIAGLGLPISGAWLTAKYDLFHGDLLNGGRGEILVPSGQ